MEDVPGFLGCSGFFGCSVVPVFRVPVFRCSWKHYRPLLKVRFIYFLHGSIDNCVSSIYMYAIRLIFV